MEARDSNNEDTKVSMPDNITQELLSVLKRFQKRIADFENRDEVQITADIQDAVAGILNSKYELHISREFTMGRAIKKLGETDLYIYSEKNGHIIDYAVLENKYIENFTNQYNQLMGYLNQNFKFGITLSMNKNMTLESGFDKIEIELRAIKGNFRPVKIEKIGEGYTLMIVSEHIVPETGHRMKVYKVIPESV